MARVKKAKKEQTKKSDFHCIDCAFSEWDRTFINLNFKGESFMLRCPFTHWKRFQEDDICDRFVKKTEEEKQLMLETRKPDKKKKETLNDFLNSLYE